MLHYPAMMDAQRLIAGAMSGTSADGVDVALVSISGRGLGMSAKLLRWHHRPFPAGLRDAICRLRAGKAVSLKMLADAGREISLHYAAAVNEALMAAGLDGSKLTALAAHGQTLYHDPPDTIQWLDPALVASEVGCTVVSDFRRADCAAGGQGAPMVPLADFLLFGGSGKHRVLLNLGGIANLTYLPAGRRIDELVAFDTGPGNCISDHLMRLHDPGGIGWDEGGRRAAEGKTILPIVTLVLAAPYFTRPPPKSTDGTAMIQLFSDAQSLVGQGHSPADLLHTGCEIAAESIFVALRQFLGRFPDEIIVSGGGVKNHTLMSLLHGRLDEVPLRTSDDLGVPAGAKEAIAFALLGAATLDGIPGNIPSATGARRAVVGGAITPKP
jgi:anhydro-N-acetylmuramic acid kinase